MGFNHHLNGLLPSNLSQQTEIFPFSVGFMVYLRPQVEFPIDCVNKYLPIERYLCPIAPGIRKKHGFSLIQTHPGTQICWIFYLNFIFNEFISLPTPQQTNSKQGIPLVQLLICSVHSPLRELRGSSGDKSNFSFASRCWKIPSKLARVDEETVTGLGKKTSKIQN